MKIKVNKNVISAFMAFQVMMQCVYVGAAAENDMHIFRCTENAAPGEVFNIYGCNLWGEMSVYGTPPDDENSIVKFGIVNTDEDGDFITVKFPAQAAPGQYSLWINNGVSNTEKITLNAPKPQWLEYPKCAKGESVRIFGRNLMPEEFGSGERASVRFTNGAEVYYPSITEVNPFAITVQPDYDIPTGSYKVEVSNGNNIWKSLEYIEYGENIEVVNPVNDIMSLNVWWADNFKWNSITTLNAEPGEDITSRLQEAIYNAHNSGGGVVVIPEGTFYTGSIAVRDNVIIRGSGKDKTYLVYDADGGTVIIGQWIYGGNVGICDLSISIADENSWKKYPGSVIWIKGDEDVTKQIFIKNCSFKMPMMPRWNGQTVPNNSSNIDGDTIKCTDDGICMPIFVSASSDVIIEGCDIEGYLCGPWIDHTGGKYIRVSDCRTKTTAGNMHIAGSCTVAENNTVITDTAIAENPYDYNSSGIVARGPSFIAGNVIEGAGRDGHNDGEAIFAENAGAPPGCYGKVVGAGTKSIQINPTDYDNEFDINNPLWGQWHILITSGKGTGQYRVINGMERAAGGITFDIDREWDIVPDAESEAVVILPSKGVTLYQNTAKNCAKGFWFYHDCIDSVMYGNTSIDSSGCLVRSQKGDTLAVSYFNQMIKNNVEGVSKKSGSSAIGEEAVLWVDEDVLGHQSYGSVISENTYKGNAESIVVPDVLDCGHIDGIYLGHANRIEMLSDEAVKGGIITDNTIEDSRCGITVGGSIYPKTWFFSNSFLSEGTKEVVLSGNNFKNVEKEYVYTLGDGLIDSESLVVSHNNAATGIEADVERGNVLTAKVDLRNVSEEKEKFRMILAAYSDGCLAEVSGGETVDIPLGSKGTVSASIDLTSYWNEKMCLKAFIWDMDTLIPCTTSFSINPFGDDALYKREVVIFGNAGSQYAGKNVMAIVTGPNAEKISGEDIIYMNQTGIKQDGAYSFTFKMYDDAGYRVFVNYGAGNVMRSVDKAYSAVEFVNISLETSEN
ncbi:MAG: hypothetical protein J6N52_08250 [Clostridia bacterium]|nr:hypothetical protein [Clostridia bacterium]